MDLQFRLSIVISVSLVKYCFTSSLPVCKNSNYIRREILSYDFQEAYPSYFSTIDDAMLQSISYGTWNLERLGKTSAKKVSVDDFGAHGDGVHDDTAAFEKAWKEACSLKGAVFVVSKKKQYLLKPITFSGPCKSGLKIKIYGSIQASSDRSDYKEDTRHWLKFDSLENLAVDGGGNINGHGQIWWQNSCKVNRSLPCKSAPTALTFYNCTSLEVKNLSIRDGQQMHVRFENCVGVQASHLEINAPEKSPNTDGIHVTRSQDIQLSDCIIGTGDDCVSIVNGSENIKATNISCGPGHGISIGSLGSGNSEAYVSNVTVDGANIFGTTNGVRIKTWQGGSGSATNIKFMNINMEDVENPILIDQNYCDQNTPCKEQVSAVQVKDVLYKNINGTSASSAAITFNCSKSFPCLRIMLQDVDIAVENGNAEAICNNVITMEQGSVSPHCP